MTKRLLLFIICASIFNLGCAQNTTPQPQITILSVPTASPSPEPSPLTTTTPVTDAKDNFTPEDTIQAFCQADFNGARTSLDKFQEVIPYVIWEVTLETDAYVISDYKVVNSIQAEDEATIAVVYTRVGKLFEGKLETFAATSDTITYKLVKEEGRWKIQYPQPAAYISMSVAKKLVKK